MQSQLNFKHNWEVQWSVHNAIDTNFSTNPRLASQAKLPIFTTLMQISWSVELMMLIERRVHSLELVTDCINNTVLH